MEEGQPPPSSQSRKKERRSGSDADADAGADADDPKPTPRRDGLGVVDNPPWGRPVREVQEPAPAAWRSHGLQLIDDDPPWGKRAREEVQEPAPAARRLKRVHQGEHVCGKRARGEVQEPAPAARRLKRVHQGQERKQGDGAGRGVSPLKQRQAGASRKGGHLISGEPQDTSSQRKPLRLCSDDTRDILPTRTSRGPQHYWEESEDNKLTLVSQDTSELVRDAMVSSRDKEDLYLNIKLGARSKCEGKAWRCVCQAINSPKPKLVFGLPKFYCACGRKFLQENNLEFCLANVRVNNELVVSKIFSQKGPHCIANALCQAILMMYTMDCVTKGMEVEESMLYISPNGLIKAYSVDYPLMDQGLQSPIQPSSTHKFIKMALMLKNRGIQLEDGSLFKIGDISFIDKNNHEEICEELANGNPLLAMLTPGVNFENLKHCQVYRPPLLHHFHECNNFHTQRPHEAHMVVLVGPAFKAKGKTSGRAYYFANSHAAWCERKIVDDYYEFLPGIMRPVNYGIGKIEEEGLVYSVIKLWKSGERAGCGSITLEDEDVDEANKYKNKPCNRLKFTGQYAHPNI